MLTNIYKRVMFIVAFMPHLPAFAASNDLCVGTGYTLGFFNGVWNTPVQAAEGLAALQSLVGKTYNSEPVQYEAFYNHTGSTAGGTGLQDIAEVFEQRALEIDSSGELGKRWELFWESLSGNKSLTDKLLGLFPSAVGLFSQLYADISSKMMGSWASLLSNPPTVADYAAQDARLDALATQKQKLMLVAHSQGNLFMNHAYDHIVSKVTANSVKAAHIAPASPTLRGEHILADIDLIINGLRIQGFSSVPPVNLALPVASSDISGHTLIGTYLDGSRPGRAAVSGLISSAMRQLIPPSTAGNAGSFTVTLTWNGGGDVDLHAVEPNGSHVYYAAPAGAVGYLDVDNTSANGPEHYYASCDSSVLQAGTYHLGIVNYRGATGRIATMQIASSKDGVLATKSLDVGPEQGFYGNPTSIPVFDLVVVKDGALGSVAYSVH